MTGQEREQLRLVLYAPALCPDCGSVFRSDVPMARPPWITPTYRATGGRCPRCGGRGSIPIWTYRFHAAAVHSRVDASDQQRWAQAAVLEAHLRRHRTAKRTQTFIQEFSGPWKQLTFAIKGTPVRARRAQLTFLLWILQDAG